MNRTAVHEAGHFLMFLKEAIKGKYVHILFLGDYLDPYPDEATPEEALEGFKDIIKFKEENPELVTLLLGNHKNFLCVRREIF